MVVDSSALTAILLRETGWESIAARIEAAPVVLVSTTTLVETCVVVSSRRKADARALVHGFLRRAGATLVPFDPDHADAAIAGFLRFGKGRHAAALNFGDCMAYGLAQVSGMGLLFTGDDFGKTDVRKA